MAAHRKQSPMDHPVVLTLLIFAIIAFMFEASEVLKPLALAILLCFALVPISRIFERMGLPRVPSVVLTVLVVMGTLGFVGYEVGQQLNGMADQLPELEDKFTAKLQGLQPTQANAISKVKVVVGDVSKALQPKSDEENIQQVRVVSEPDFGAQVSKLVGPYLEGLGSAFIILILLLYMMINRENMSDRLTRLFGHGKISLTTRTIEEVGQRISKYLVMFASVNSAFGIVVGVGLYLIGVPNALLWGFLAGALRFIPYAGAATAIALPLLFTYATEPGYTKLLEVVALYAILELAMNMALEPMIYGRTTGVSALALLVAAMFWTWLWGGIGLLLSTPLTVCLAVLGKYVPSLGFFATFLHEEVDLDPGIRFYQRLLAMDQDGASAVIDPLFKKYPRAEVFDKVLMPTLSMAERDFARGDIDEREQAFILRTTIDVIDDLAGEPEIDLATLSHASGEGAVAAEVEASRLAELATAPKPKILALPAADATDVLALKILANLLEASGQTLMIAEEVESPLKVVERITAETPDLVIISHLPPDGLTAARYLVRRIKARHPKLTVVVGRWDEASEAETAAEKLGEAGASTTLGSLAAARDYLISLAHPAPVETSLVGTASGR